MRGPQAPMIIAAWVIASGCSDCTAEELTLEAGVVDARATEDAAEVDGAVIVDATAPRDASEDDAPSPDDAAADAGAGDAADSGDPRDSGADDAGDAGLNPDASTIGEVIVRGPIGFPLAVVFHDPTGAVISSKTSTLGEVRETVLSGSMLTAIVEGGFPSYMETITGLEPGDTYEYFGTAPFGSARVEVALPGPYSPADHYSIDYGCGESLIADPASPQIITVESRCVGTATQTAALLAIAHAADDTFLAYSILDGVSLTPTGTTTAILPAWETNFDLPTVTITNPPAGVGSAVIQRGIQLRTAHFALRSQAVNGLFTSPAATVTFRHPPIGDATSLGVTAYYDFAGISELGSYGPARATATVDLSTSLLPLVLDATVAVTLADVARPTVSWTPPAEPVDVFVVGLFAKPPGLIWSLILPPGTSSIQVPALPDEYAHLRLTIDSSPYAGMMIMESNAIADYRALRRSTVLFNGFSTFSNAPIGTIIRLSRCPATEFGF